VKWRWRIQGATRWHSIGGPVEISCYDNEDMVAVGIRTRQDRYQMISGEQKDKSIAELVE